MKQPTRREALMYGVIGGVLGASAFDKGMQLFRERPVEFDYSVHVLSDEQLQSEKMDFFKEKSPFLHYNHVKHNGYLEMGWKRGYPDVDLEMYSNTCSIDFYYPELQLRDLPIFIERPISKETFDIYATHRGEGFHWEEAIDFLNNETLLDAIVKHARVDNLWRYPIISGRLDNQLVDIPTRYILETDTVTYEVEDMPTLLDGNKDRFEEFWRHQVLYA